VLVLAAVICTACGRGDTEFEGEWRARARAKFGASMEEQFHEGVRFSYVAYAHEICDMSESDRRAMANRLKAYWMYEGSLDQFVIEEFCPYV
jgi:hypothetical protein